MKSSKYNVNDNSELDLIEGLKGFSFIFIQFYTSSSYAINIASNTWRLTDFFSVIFFTFAVCVNICMEVFFIFSAFFGAYHCF